MNGTSEKRGNACARIYVVLLSGLALICLCSVAAGGPTNPSSATRIQPSKPPTVRTNYETDARLTAEEVKQVLLLAKQCGIAEPGEISTFHYIPSGGKGIEVNSVERQNGRDIFFDGLTVYKTGWTGMAAEKKVTRRGDFWAKPSDKSTGHLRVYDFRGKNIRVEIIDGFSVTLADKVIPLIAAKKVRFAPKSDVLGSSRDSIERMLTFTPSALSKESDGKLWLHVKGSWDVLQFRFEKGEVVPEQVIMIQI